MAIKRKCPECDTWNDGAADYCITCNELISPTIIEEIRKKKREDIERQKPKDKIDIFLEKWKTSRFFLVRMVYYIVYSIVAIVGGISLFFAYITVGANG